MPDALDDERAVFASSLGRVLHAARMLRLEGKTYVSILGDGPIGLLAAQVMAKRNASVRLLGTNAANLELCTKWGVKHRAQHEVGRRQDQDVVFDCTGTDESVDLAISLVRPRGSVVLMRTPRETATISPASIIRDELQVFGSRGCAIGEAVAELAAERVDVLSLIARRLRFDDGPQALVAAREPGTLKILLDAA
ncbi:MAG: zinc-binding dehydrogenase [Planctomycetota bacterium]|nr:MAG: zinc-binding dehydrogenase [Planctomycetota bacterium]